MQSVQSPQNMMTNSFRPQQSQGPPPQVNQFGNSQLAGAQSTYPHEQDPNFRSNSYILNREQQQVKTSFVQMNQQNAELRSNSYLPQKEPLKSSIIMDPKDRPLHTLQEFEFNRQILHQPTEPPVVTTYPEKAPTHHFEPYEPKKREEYCGLFTNSKPEGYQKGKISQNDNDEKENEYWLCRIF